MAIRKNITRLLLLALLLMHTHNNTDSNKLVIFSGTVLYYGNTYIICHPCLEVQCKNRWVVLITE